jgi:2',3'-cyclic-nucleotide 2'-phosphodiesterase (5'-nucleotidase family)
LEFGASNYPEERGNFMQVSGITYTIDSRIPSSVKLDDKGNFLGVTGEYRVKDVMVNGKPLDLKANYTVGGSNYVLKNGGDGNVMFKDCKLLQDGQISDVDAIMEYVQNYLNAKIPAEYEAWDGQKRIKIIK